eukprot:766462-Hanusia_phi.AAC.9
MSDMEPGCLRQLSLPQSLLHMPLPFLLPPSLPPSLSPGHSFQVNMILCSLLLSCFNYVFDSTASWKKISAM